MSLMIALSFSRLLHSHARFLGSLSHFVSNASAVIRGPGNVRWLSSEKSDNGGGDDPKAGSSDGAQTPPPDDPASSDQVVL